MNFPVIINKLSIMHSNHTLPKWQLSFSSVDLFAAHLNNAFNADFFFFHIGKCEKHEFKLVICNFPLIQIENWKSKIENRKKCLLEKCENVTNLHDKSISDDWMALFLVLCRVSIVSISELYIFMSWKCHDWRSIFVISSTESETTANEMMNMLMWHDKY